jgi:transposase
LKEHKEAELGIVAAQGYEGLKAPLSIVADSSDARLAEHARASLSALAAQIASCQAQIGVIEKRPLAQHRKNVNSKRLETIPGIGVLDASAIVATVPDASIFKKRRDFAAWLSDCTGEYDVMRNGRAVRSGEPRKYHAFKVRRPDWNPIRGSHHDQRPKRLQR